MNNNDVYEDGLKALAEAIVERAVMDYRKLVQYEIKHYGRVLSDEERKNGKKERRYLPILRNGLSAKSFFLSKRFNKGYGYSFSGEQIVKMIEDVGLDYTRATYKAVKKSLGTGEDPEHSVVRTGRLSLINTGTGSGVIFGVM